ncbi:MAG: hypothetical protein OK436_07585, partial [Thaumarchaeota archaeon]|nr:hypothetical protein [Nitrososphaerota archaeon]
GRLSHGEEVGDVVMHLDSKGRPLFFELLNASKIVPMMVQAMEKGKGKTIQIAPLKRGTLLAWKDLDGIKPHVTGKPEWPTPKEIKSIWE